MKGSSGLVRSSLVAAFSLVQFGCTPSGPDPSSDSSTVESADPGPRWVDIDLVDNGLFAAGCAVEASGALWCWGQDPLLHAELRANIEPPDGLARPTRSAPTRVREVDDARRVAVSFEQVCRIDADGRVRCFGEWGTWQEVGEVVHAVELRVFQRWGCARQADERLRCWEADGPSWPVAQGVRAFGLERSGGCALVRNDEVVCWQHPNERGRPIAPAQSRGRAPGAVDLDLDPLGPGVWILDDRGGIARAVLRPALTWDEVVVIPDAVEIVASRFAVCVQTRAGALHCRGQNQYGQLGQGDSSAREHFVTVIPSGVHGFALTDLRTCGRTLDEILCAGLDLAALENPAVVANEHTLDGLEAVSLAAHGDTTCALDVGGDVRCWGWQLLDPFQVTSMDVGFGVELSIQRTLVGQGQHGLQGIFTNDDSLDWVGDDGRLQRAAWTEGPAWSLRATAFGKPVRPAKIRSLVADHSVCAIEAGQPMDSLTCGTHSLEREPIPGIDGPVAVATKLSFVCAIDHRARVVCAAPPDHLHNATIVPKLVPGVADARRIALSGSGDACASLESGRVVCWSGTKSETTTVEYEPSPVEDIGLEDVVAVVGTRSRFCSLDERGAVRCWLPGPVVYPRPVPEFAKPIVELVAGSDHLCARDVRGTVTCWGDELHGQLGRLPPAVRLRPTPLRFHDPS